MFLLKTLSNIVWGEGSKGMLQVNGTFYDYYKSNWRCLFNNCTATIAHTETGFLNELQVVRVYEEAEQQLDTDSDTEDRYITPITQSIKLRKEIGPLDRIGFSWTSNNTRFLFEFDQEDKMTELFLTSLCQSVWENTHQQSSDQAPSDVVDLVFNGEGEEQSEESEEETSTSAKKEDVEVESLYPSLERLSIGGGQGTPAKAAGHPTSSSPYISPMLKRASPAPTSSAVVSESTAGPSTPLSWTPKTSIGPSTTTTTTTTTPKLTSTGTTPAGTPSMPKSGLPTPSIPQSTTSASTSSSASLPASPGVGMPAPSQPLQTPKKHESGSGMVVPPLPAEQRVFGKEVFATQADLYIFNAATATFHLREVAVDVAINNIKSSKDEIIYKLFVTKDDTVLIAQDIGSEMFMHFDKEHQSVIWVSSHEEQVFTWSLMFPNEESDQGFKDRFSVCLYETNAGESFQKVNQADREWIIGGLRDEVEGMEPDDGVKEFDLMRFEDKDKEEEEEEEESQKTEDSVEEEEEEEEEDEEEGGMSEDESKSKNSALAVGYKYDRSFVVRGSRIGVFEHTPSQRLRYRTTIKNVKTPRGQLFSPKKVMLHNEDDALLLLHPEDRHKIYKMDLHRGDVVEEWTTDERFAVNEILPETKYAQMTPVQTLVGLNRQSYFKLDPRLSGNKQVDTKSFTYGFKTAPKLSCATATESGQLAIGSEKGQIRMFSRNTFARDIRDPLDRKPRAKTTLPGYGDPITGIDVTADGKWILATCKTYLLVVPTSFQGTNGFETPMGKNKPVPRRLQLKPEHIEMMGGNISFTPARFNVGQEEERSIVTSTGPYVIAWNFRKVKQNKLNEYQIKKYDDVIVADQFKYGEDKAVVVAMPNDVTMARRGVVKQLF
jgi:hypothetical protein